jgi:uncharacterized protein (TIGR02186 family)
VAVLRVALLLILVCQAGPAFAERLVTDISERQIAITSNFKGTTLLIFGAVQQGRVFEGGLADNDIVIVVRGPARDMVVRKKERMAGIWVNADSVTFSGVPGYYAVASNRPLKDIASPELLDRIGIGLDHLSLKVKETNAPEAVIPAFREAIIRQQKNAFLFLSAERGVTLLAQTLFRANLIFPATVPVGDYRVEAYLLKDGRIVSAQSSPLSINKSGIERSLYILAHEASYLYGLIAVALAVLAGWTAGLVFRKR